jgi:hypothetical protein
MTEKRPIMGIAPLNKFYKPAVKNQLVEVDSFSAPKSKLSITKGAQVSSLSMSLSLCLSLSLIPHACRSPSAHATVLSNDARQLALTSLSPSRSLLFLVLSFTRSRSRSRSRVRCSRARCLR